MAFDTVYGTYTIAELELIELATAQMKKLRALVALKLRLDDFARPPSACHSRPQPGVQVEFCKTPPLDSERAAI